MIGADPLRERRLPDRLEPRQQMALFDLKVRREMRGEGLADPPPPVRERARVVELRPVPGAPREHQRGVVVVGEVAQARLPAPALRAIAAACREIPRACPTFLA